MGVMGLFAMQILNVFNTFLNDWVRNIDPFLKGLIALGFFAFGLYCLAKGITKKDKPNPIKIGWGLCFLVCMGISFLYTFY